MMSLNIKGDAKFRAVLASLPEKLERSVVRGGMRVLALTIADEAKLRVMSGANFRSGPSRAHAQDVKDSIKAKSSVLSKGIIASYVYTRGKGAFIAPWLEFGTGAHLISVREDLKPARKKRDGRMEAWSVKLINKAVKRGSLVIGDKYVGASVQHPGADPSPFLRPAVDAKLQAGITAMAEYISMRLERAGIDMPPEPEDGEQ